MKIYPKMVSLKFADNFNVERCLQLLASASYDNTVRLYREEDDDWVCKATLEGHTATVWGLAFDPSGQRLASCSDDRTVKIWKECRSEAEQGRLQRTRRDAWLWESCVRHSGYMGTNFNTFPLIT